MEEKILIVNVNWVGDVIFSTPFIRAVREARPRSHIACLLHPRCREVLEANPRIDEIIIYDEEGIHRSLWGKLKLIRALRRKKFDTAFLLHRSFTKAFLAYSSGITRRVGYATKNRKLLLTEVVEEMPQTFAHKVEYFLNVARAAGIPAKDTRYEFFVSEGDRNYAKTFLAERGVSAEDLLVVINPGGNWLPKRWPKENFARLADTMVRKYGAKVVITGSKNDSALAEAIKLEMENASLIACGATTLGQSAALLERADLVVANDTGPMHIAVAMGAPVLALFGPTSPGITGPYGAGEYKVIYKNDGCEVPCYDLTCTEFACMKAIGVEDVLAAANEMLAKNPKIRLTHDHR